MPPGLYGSWGPDVGAYATRVLGIRLDRHQQRVLNRALAYGEDGRLLHRLYLYSTGRQNGKTVTVRSLIGWALTADNLPRWQTIIGVAHDKKQARIPYRAVRNDLTPLAKRVGRSELGLTTYLGMTSNMHGIHRTYDIGTREARNALRGESIDLAPFDEVRTQIDLETYAALGPTMLARPEPLGFATSTAGNDRSVLLRMWFDRALRIIDGQEPAGEFGMTWYASSERFEPDDPRDWREAHPAFAEGRLRAAAIRELAAEFGGFDSATWRREGRNLWTDAIDDWLPGGAWTRQNGPQPALQGRVVFGVEAVPSWSRATVTVALPTPEGAWFGIAGELDASQPRPSGIYAPSIPPDELVDKLRELAAVWRPAAVAYVGTAAAAPYVEAWAEEADVLAVKLGAKELRSASELFRSELIGGRLTHADDPLLALQARTVRPSHPIESGAWYLSVRESAGEVDAIRAAAWASWAAIAPAEAGLPPQIFV